MWAPTEHLWKIKLAQTDVCSHRHCPEMENKVQGDTGSTALGTWALSFVKRLHSAYLIFLISFNVENKCTIAKNPGKNSTALQEYLGAGSTEKACQELGWSAELF